MQPRSVVALVAALACSAACSEPAPTPPSSPAGPAAYVWPAGPQPHAVIAIEGFGEIEIELYPTLAPSTVRNFTKLATSGFYAGTTFHRVIPGFMLQAGDPNTKDNDPRNDGDGGPGFHIEDEFTDAPHVRGVVSMANTSTKNSGSSQFFILQADALHLDGHHSVFGRVTRGMEIVDAIAAVETDRHGRWGPAHRPLTNVVIRSIEVRAAGESREPAIGAIPETNPRDQSPRPIPEKPGPAPASDRTGRTSPPIRS